MRQPKNHAADDTSVVLVQSITNGKRTGWGGSSRRRGIPTRCRAVYTIVAVADNILTNMRNSVRYRTQPARLDTSAIEAFESSRFDRIADTDEESL
jgi:hypothetical protein